jgi:hypothetical protein
MGSARTWLRRFVVAALVGVLGAAAGCAESEPRVAGLPTTPAVTPMAIGPGDGTGPSASAAPAARERATDKTSPWPQAELPDIDLPELPTPTAPATKAKIDFPKGDGSAIADLIPPPPDAPGVSVAAQATLWPVPFANLLPPGTPRFLLYMETKVFPMDELAKGLEAVSLQVAMSGAGGSIWVPRPDQRYIRPGKGGTTEILAWRGQYSQHIFPHAVAVRVRLTSGEFFDVPAYVTRVVL